MKSDLYRIQLIKGLKGFFLTVTDFVVNFVACCVFNGRFRLWLRNIIIIIIIIIIIDIELDHKYPFMMLM